MSVLHGVDGCPAGWIVASLDTESQAAPQTWIYASLGEFGQDLRRNDLVAIDMPIGLSCHRLHGTFRRACDVAARTALGTRRNSVFFTPDRGVLAVAGKGHREASAWHRERTGKGISRQAHGILRKIAGLDDWIHDSRAVVKEVHPELSFAMMRSCGGNPEPMRNRKATAAGFAERLTLLPADWQKACGQAFDLRHERGGLGGFTKREHGKARRRWPQDDLLDAFACLWTARRIARGESLSFPDSPAPIDATDLPMQIHA